MTMVNSDLKGLKVKYAFNLETQYMLGFKFHKSQISQINFYSLEVVCHGSEAQLQVIENFN